MEGATPGSDRGPDAAAAAAAAAILVAGAGQAGIGGERGARDLGGDGDQAATKWEWRPRPSKPLGKSISSAIRKEAWRKADKHELYQVRPGLPAWFSQSSCFIRMLLCLRLGMWQGHRLQTCEAVHARNSTARCGPGSGEQHARCVVHGCSSFQAAGCSLAKAAGLSIRLMPAEDESHFADLLTPCLTTNSLDPSQHLWRMFLPAAPSLPLRRSLTAGTSYNCRKWSQSTLTPCNHCIWVRVLV